VEIAKILKSKLKLSMCANAAHAVTLTLGQSANLAFEDGLKLAM
jgi:2-polyprenyl-6-methoxyphenol hydroxylase-like FAD-dependent oxidoreductase